MASPASQRKTRRSSRQVVLDELDLVMRRLEQIKSMVDKHCIAPSASAPSAFAKATTLKTKGAPPAPFLTPVEEEESEGEGEVKSMPANSESQLERARSLEAKANAPIPSASATTPRKRKSGGCPGGPKAYNKFVVDWLAEQRASGREITHQEALKEIKETGVYARSCGLEPKKNVTRKLSKTPVTPGRVNAIVSPPVAAPLESSQAPPPTPPALPQQEAENATPAPPEQEEQNATPPAPEEEEQNATPPQQEAENVTPSPPEEAENAAPPPQQEEQNAAPPPPEQEGSAGYEDLGMDDTTGMRRITANGRELFMTNGNSGLFERNGNAPGEFVGYLKDGKIQPASPPQFDE